MNKDTGMRIRVERELRESFLESCREVDRPAAQVIREFMRDFVASTASRNLSSTKQKRYTESEVRTPTPEQDRGR